MNARRRFRQPGVRLCRCLVVGLSLLGYQNHSCGCRSAEQCWQSCCCYSAKEKVAWANAHQVEPPAAVVVEANKGWSSPRLRDQHTAKKRPCCAKCSKPAPEAAPAAALKTITWVAGIAARHCQGQSELWLSGGAAVPPPAPLTWAFEWTPAGRLAPADPAFSSFGTSPSPPPPRA